jgi:catechol 2,3-dioxygenase
LDEAGWHLTGAGDHLVSEALYLEDPDGNGIELYADRPRDTWTFTNGRVHMDTLSVDIDSLIAEARTEPAPWTGLPVGTTMGHIHLKVSDLEAAEHFYCELIGFDLMATMPQALFVAAGGYHHHLGLNTWMSAGSPPAPPDSLGLNAFTIVFPDEGALEEVVGRLRQAGIDFEQTENGVFTRDPSGNGVRLEAHN